MIGSIDKAIDYNGEIKDDASPELKRVRREIQHRESEQRMMLTRVIKRYSEFSQDDIVTLRDGRMVLGIQPQYVNQVNGIVHGTSGTGATIFIEPMETLRISNEIQNLKLEERREIIRILQYLSSQIRSVRDDIYFAIENYGYLDFVLAKAKLAQKLNATQPQLSEKPLFKLNTARHPLLLLKIGSEKVVPCSLELGKDFHTLVITGPNAGGKTVALKTAGLMIAMTQLGMLIPAEEDSIIPLLDNILVDIGDRQDIENDLSTFSAHILRLQEILRQANTHSLILIDEIGSGTDPKEGSALSIALLGELNDRKALTIATTHHGELKAFAFATIGVENASMEFNTETLQPSYKLQIGIPGSSYAFEIARRYGFTESVLQAAEKIIGPDKGALERLILDMNDKLQKISEERREISIKLTEVNGLKNLYENQVSKLKKEKSDLQRKATEEAQRIVDEANAKIEKAVADIRAQKADKKTIKAAHDTVKSLKEDIRKNLKSVRKEKQQTDKLEIGDTVRIESLRENGEIVSQVDTNNKAWVLVGAIRLQLDAEQLKKTSKKARKKEHVFRKANAAADAISEGIMPELDLRGMDSIEAIEATDKYLHQVMEEGWEEVQIIHGKGTGVLRTKINEFLARDKRIADKRYGKWGEGDTGGNDC